MGAETPAHSSEPTQPGSLRASPIALASQFVLIIHIFVRFVSIILIVILSTLMPSIIILPASSLSRQALSPSSS